MACSHSATHISYGAPLPVPLRSGTMAALGGIADPFFYGKPSGLWFAPGLTWVELLQAKKSWKVREEIGEESNFPYVLPFYKSVLEGPPLPPPQEGDVFQTNVPKEAHYVYSVCLDGKLSDNLETPDRTKVFWLKDSNEEAFRTWVLRWATERFLAILRNKSDTPYEARFLEQFGEGPAREYLKGLGIEPPKTDPCKRFYRNYILRAVVADLLLRVAPEREAEIRAAAQLLPMSASTFQTTGLLCSVVQNAPKATPKVLCGAEKNVCVENLAALEENVKATYQLNPRWRDILAPVGSEVPKAYNAVVNQTLGEFYRDAMSTVWGGIWFDESLFAKGVQPGTWKFALERASICLWHPEAVLGKDWLTPKVLAWAPAPTDKPENAYVAGLTEKGEIRLFHAPAKGGSRGRTFRRKPRRRNKNGGRPTRKSKHGGNQQRNAGNR